MSTCQHSRQIVFAYWLEQVAHCLDIKGFNGMLFISCTKHNGRRLLELQKMASCLQAVHARHTNIQQHQIGPIATSELHSLDPVTGFANHIVTLKIVHHAYQPVPG